MSKNLQFIWIDDDPSREREVQNIEEATSARVIFINVKSQDLGVILSKLLEGEPPDLILMDHKLENVKFPLIETGSSAAEILREKWPTYPIICITAVGPANISSHRRNIYEEVLDSSSISQHYPTLVSIAESFTRLRAQREWSVDQILDLLQVPEVDTPRLTTILPGSLKTNFLDESLPLSISKWVRGILMKRPGFLYDKLWAATLIGLTVDGFDKVSKYFEDAKYKGIFSSTDQERWWQSRLRMTLSSIVEDAELIYPWKQGRELPGLAEGDYSKCHRSNENYPETVAFLDETTTTMAAMRLKYTVHHPMFQNSLFFEEMRMMKGSE